MSQGSMSMRPPMKICATVVLKICAAPRTVTTVAAWSGDSTSSRRRSCGMVSPL
jgi:hypothetical protein